MKKYKVIFKQSEDHSLVKSKEDENVVILSISNSKIKDPYGLCSLIMKRLGRFKRLEVDMESWDSLKFDNVSEDSKSLMMPIVQSALNFIPYSLKTEGIKEKDKYKWEFTKEFSCKAKQLVKGIETTKRLQATPPNIMTTTKFVEEIKELFKGIESVKIKEIVGEDIHKENLGLLYAVGKASENPPRLLILEYIKDPSKEIKALVGKGICYDSGGLNIKTGPYMSTMKFDMSGGAVSAGVMYSIASNNSSQNLVVAIPLAENSISSKSYRPDDVIVSRSGKSIEIDNTDAEGRLVLADAMSYTIDSYKPSEIITIATLTGAIGYALGSKYGGVWTSEEKQWDEFKECLNKSFEFGWRMPFDNYYTKALKKSNVADLKNSARTGEGGASRAACFLKEFSNNLPYIHLDIANIAHTNDDEPRAPMFRTLYHYLYRE